MRLFAAAVKRRRKRSRRLVLVATFTTLVGAGIMVLLPMRCGRGVGSETIATPAVPRVVSVPRVELTNAVVTVDGALVARTDAIDGSKRLQKIDGLFEAMRARRFEDESAGTHATTVDLMVGQDVSAVVVKSAFQTLSFAGYSDVRFVLEDGGTISAGGGNP